MSFDTTTATAVKATTNVKGKREKPYPFSNRTLRRAVRLWLLSEDKTSWSAEHQQALRQVQAYGPIAHWDTSRVTDMRGLFAGAWDFDQPLHWDTRQVTNMACMFYDARRFRQPLLFDTRRVIHMEGMLAGTEIEKQLGCTTMDAAFMRWANGCARWARRKHIVTVLSENGFLTGTNMTRIRPFEVVELARLIVSFV
jgi:hypothetical protein